MMTCEWFPPACTCTVYMYIQVHSRLAIFILGLRDIIIYVDVDVDMCLCAYKNHRPTVQKSYSFGICHPQVKHKLVRQDKSRLIGPNCPGIIRVHVYIQ